MKFDLSGIPYGATIKSAVLELYASKSFKDTYPNGGKSVHAITTAWDETTVTYDQGKPWNNRGGDFNATPEASSNNSSFGVWEEYDVTTMVNSIVNKGQTNNGFMVKVSSEKTNDVGASFLSSEYFADMSLRPKLVVTIDTPTGVVEKDAHGGIQIFDIITSGNSCVVSNPLESACVVELFTVRGQQLDSKSLGVRNSVVLSGLSQGYYILKIRSADIGVIYRTICIH